MRQVRICVLLALVLLVGACGGSSGKKSSDQAETSTTTAAPKPAEPATLAAAAISTQETSSAAIDVEFGATGTDEDGTVRFHGRADFETGDAELTIEANGAAANEPDLAEPTTLRIVDKTAYAQVTDAMAERLGVSTPWVSASSEQLGFSSGDDPLSGLTDLTTPGKSLDLLKNLTGEVTSKGTVERGGVKTTLYHTELGVADFTKAAGGDPAAAGMLALFGGLKMPLDVYVDDDGRVRELTLTWDLSGFGDAFSVGSTSTSVAPEPMVVTMSFRFSDFGADVEVEAPPADEVTPLPEGEELFPDDESSASDDDDGPDCTGDKIDTVRTAISAYRAQEGDETLEPTLQDLVDAGLLAEVPQGVEVEYQNGGPGISASC